MTESPDSPVLCTIADGIGRIRLNRPDSANGLDVELLRALNDAVLACHGSPDVRVVMLTGEGKNFCAGGDVKTFASKGEALPDYLREATAWLQIATASLIRLKVPVVTAVHGFAAGGGGLGLLCASDIVVAARSAKVFSGAVRVGMAPDGGATVTLAQLVGLRKALEILLLNPTLTAEDALNAGLITEVVDDADLAARVEDVARQLSDMAPLALSATKRLVWDGVGAPIEARLGEEARVVSTLSGTADSREGLAAVIERRAPKFIGS
ncbi:enoyl-CoA hydratase/isomerase family protein [Gordonia polyisoprenivorans]|uniref:enoyl-CoA hydratase/isomerase family protein n=1 Tax=Gordonia polyisoprenivorans TaxID=84595 RepID=UPI001AD6B25C|nr:enoyl-CoA hydratase-related protein [Gordonia polyisoprenivorans]QTI69049.1 enoyl-CoA hydratase/isomerase family protein [Gordonia polyisoprenivorans]